jgi:hypothetical protein
MSALKQAIARMRSSVVSINDGDPDGPIGSGVIVRGGNGADGIVATALHVVRDVPSGALQIGFPVPPSGQARGRFTMMDATIRNTSRGTARPVRDCRVRPRIDGSSPARTRSHVF